jgi:tetratricopeptide (TPR) repeat protein
MKTIRLTTLLAIAIFASPDLVYAQTENLSKVKAHLSELLKNDAVIYEVIVKTYTLGTCLGTPKEVLVLDDRIEFKFNRKKAVMYFADELDRTVYASDYGYVPLRSYSFKMGKKAGELADDLIFIKNYFHFQTHQQRNQQRQDSLLALFKPIAAQYHELKVKPTVTEEQRELIVQANALNQKKMYDRAIEFYNKAIEIDPTAYPPAYSNLALLSAQIEKFDDAIYYMKKYLLLEPEASDARSAQDKIYEWKISVPKE